MTWVFWLVGTVGIGGILLGGAILVFGLPVIVGTRIGRMALATGAAALALVGAYLSGRSKGRAAERAKLKWLVEKEVGVSHKERARINAMTDAEVDEELALRWEKP